MKVFISYSRLDSDLGTAVYNYLRDTHEVFIDTKKIAGGEEWEKVIETEISKCDRFILILTLSSINREEVKKEIVVAIDKKKKIIPCIHSSIEIKKIPSELKRYHGIQFEEGPELGRKLLAMINREEETHNNNEEKNIVTNVYEKKQNFVETEFSHSKKNQNNNWSNQADIFLERKKYQKAIEYYDQALEIDPNYTIAQNNKIALERLPKEKTPPKKRGFFRFRKKS